MRKILTSLALATALAIPTTIVAAPAKAATPPPAHLHISDNKSTFNKKHTGAFKIRVTAHHKNGKALNGKARLYIGGRHLLTRDLNGGRITFQVGRARLPNNKTTRVKVRVMPWNTHMRDRIVTRTVIDRVPKRNTNSGAKVVQVAKKQVGARYVWGASGPSAYDCSGLTRYAWKHGAGKNLPHSSAAQKNIGRKVSSPRAGDLVWSPGHVAIYIGDGKVVEAATPATGVRVSRIWQKNPTYIRP